MSTSTTEKKSPVGSGGWVLGACMGLSNVLGYAFVLLVSRTLGPADFGAFSAVNNASIFVSLPASAFQVVVAAHQARGHGDRTGIGLSVVVGGALALVTVALSPVAAAVFHLESPLPILLVALMMPAYTLTGAAQGLLLGHRRLGALAVVYVMISVARVLAAVAAALLGSGIVGVFALLVVAAWAPTFLAVGLARRHIHRAAGLDLGLGRELLTSNGTLAVLLAMTSTDVLLARHLLPADAGTYAFAALFGKVVFWGTQFVALALVPVASTRRSRGPVLAALGLVIGLGLAASLVVVIARDELVLLLGGADYLDATGLLLPFTLLGTLWALCQVLLFADMARGRHGLTYVALVATAVAAAVILLRDTDHVVGILGPYTVAAALVTATGSARLLLRRRKPGATSAVVPEGSGTTG